MGREIRIQLGENKGGQGTETDGRPERIMCPNKHLLVERRTARERERGREQ